MFTINIYLLLSNSYGSLYEGLTADRVPVYQDQGNYVHTVQIAFTGEGGTFLRPCDFS